MRKRNDNGEISVHAIAGTEVVLLGLNATEEARKGLLGFTILKRSGSKGTFRALSAGSRTFAGHKIKGRTDSHGAMSRNPEKTRKIRMISANTTT